MDSYSILEFRQTIFIFIHQNRRFCTEKMGILKNYRSIPLNSYWFLYDPQLLSIGRKFFNYFKKKKIKFFQWNEKVKKFSNFYVSIGTKNAIKDFSFPILYSPSFNNSQLFLLDSYGLLENNGILFILILSICHNICENILSLNNIFYEIFYSDYFLKYIFLKFLYFSSKILFFQHRINKKRFFNLREFFFLFVYLLILRKHETLLRF
jgi:hypothetical protein